MLSQLEVPQNFMSSMTAMSQMVSGPTMLQGILQTWFSGQIITWWGLESLWNSDLLQGWGTN